MTPQEQANFNLMLGRYNAGTLDTRKLVNGSPPADYEVLSATAGDGKTLWSAKKAIKDKPWTEWKHGLA